MHEHLKRVRLSGKMKVEVRGRGQILVSYRFLCPGFQPVNTSTPHCILRGRAAHQLSSALCFV